MPSECTIEQRRESYQAAIALYAGGPLTVAGRALAKHNPVSRASSVFPVPAGNPAAINETAHEVVGEILSALRTVRVERGRVYDLIAPDGRGLRFHAGGVFKGFLEP